VLLLNEYLLLLFISLSTQSGNFWIHPRIFIRFKATLDSKNLTCDPCSRFPYIVMAVMTAKWGQSATTVTVHIVYTVESSQLQMSK
jgi:hypothetical protein